jgi:hypothetical protein
VAITDVTIRRIRSAALFVFGLAGITYVTVTEGTERPTLLLIFAACLGLPAFLGLDERRHDKGDKPGERGADAP